MSASSMVQTRKTCRQRDAGTELLITEFASSMAQRREPAGTRDAAIRSKKEQSVRSMEQPINKTGNDLFRLLCPGCILGALILLLPAPLDLWQQILFGIILNDNIKNAHLLAAFILCTLLTILMSSS